MNNERDNALQEAIKARDELEEFNHIGDKADKSLQHYKDSLIFISIFTFITFILIQLNH